MYINSSIRHEGGEFKLLSSPVALRKDEPGVIIECTVSGLCGTDVRMIRGERERNTSIIGHEAATYIAAHNTTRPESLQIGSRVFINPNPPELREYKGHIGHDREGLFQRYVWLSEEDFSDYVLDIVPQALTDVEALALEPLACGWHTLSKLNVECLRSRRIAVVGAGNLALVHIFLLLAAGARADHIHVFNRTVGRGHEVAATTDLPQGNCHPSDHVPENCASTFDFVLLLNSNADVHFPLAARLIRNGGSVLVFGGIAEEYEVRGLDRTIELRALRKTEAREQIAFDAKLFDLVGSRGFTNNDVTAVTEAIKNGNLCRPPLVVQEHTPQAFVGLLNSLRDSNATVPFGKQVCKFAA